MPAFSADGDAIRGNVTRIFGESLWRLFAWPTPSHRDVEGGFRAGIFIQLLGA
jgi:hypothetical protein